MSTALDTRLDETDLSTDAGSTVPSGVFDEFAGPVWAVAMHALGNAAQADQVVEASFATFTRTPGALAATVDPGIVLFSTARRIIFENMLANSSGGRRDAPSAEASWERWGSAVALGRLSEVELAVARLKHENGLASGAIAAALGLSQETIERHEDRAHTVIGVRLITDEDLFEAHRPPDLKLRARLVGDDPSASAARIEPPHPALVDANRPQPPHPHSVPPWNRPVVVSASASGEVPENVLLSWDPPVVRQPPGSHISLWTRVVAVGASVRGGPGPGLVLAAMGAMTAQMLQQFLPGASTLVLAVLVGVVIGNLGIAAEATAPGLKLAAKRLLRVGVVLLGLRLSVGEVFSLGLPALLLVATTVVITFFGVQWLGAKLGLSRDLSLLVATGYSICGASAIAAVEGSTDADEEEVAVAIGLVTLAGSLAIFVVPAVAGAVGLDEQAAGAWAGASIHDVAQVVAAGSALGTTALATAVVVKLTRVVLLAPIVAGLNARRSAAGAAVGGDSGRSRPPVMPLFVLGFLAMMALRTTGVVPLSAVELTRSIEGLLFTIALVGLGSNVRLAKLRTLGLRPLLLGVLAWLLIGATSLGGVALIY